MAHDLTKTKGRARRGQTREKREREGERGGSTTARLETAEAARRAELRPVRQCASAWHRRFWHLSL